MSDKQAPFGGEKQQKLLLTLFQTEIGTASELEQHLRAQVNHSRRGKFKQTNKKTKKNEKVTETVVEAGEKVDKRERSSLTLSLARPLSIDAARYW